VSEDDAALFREAIGEEVRVFDPPPPRPAAPRPAPRPRQREADEAEALRLSRQAGIDPRDADAPMEHLRDGVPSRVLRTLRRGHYSVQDEFDLHGLTAAAAESALRAFLHDARRADQRCVRIIHGKGRSSEDGFPVLKAVTDRYLRHRDDVLAFAQAPAAQGGSGAVLVLLAPRRTG
jgi:DNA-nicking Smr family endonuclease